MTKYEITVNGEFAGAGDTSNGCWADLPDAVLALADAGGVGTVEIDGDIYRVSEVANA